MLVSQGDVKVIARAVTGVLSRRNELFEGGANLAHIVQRHQGDELGRHTLPNRVAGALLPKRDKDGALVIARLAEGVLERRAAVADRVASYALRAMNMPEGDIVEGVVRRDVDIVDAAELDLILCALRFDATSGDKLMGQRDIAHASINLASVQHCGKRSRVIVANLQI